MKLATLDDGTRDGTLVVVSRDGARFQRVQHVARSLQAALDDWEHNEPLLTKIFVDLDAKRDIGESLDVARLAAPLPRAYEWIDGSAFLSHVMLVRKARGAQPPATLKTDPLIYQGGSGVLLGPRAPMSLGDPSWGLDFEGEVVVVLGDTPRGLAAADAAPHVRLLMLANDISLRNLIPVELEKGFGFFCSKPATAFSPFAVTPDELGVAWQGGRVHLPLRCSLNGMLVGDPDAGAMHFSFYDLMAHITRTRDFTAGTILGSGTVSNEDPARGIACLAERRMREIIESGSAKTQFLRLGDRVHIEMFAADGSSIFGAIDQEVVA